MDLNAIINPKASGKTLLFKDTRPVAQAVAKGLKDALPVQPVAPAAPASSTDLTAAIKAMSDGFADLAAAFTTPVAKAAPAPQAVAEEAHRAPHRATNVLSPSGNAPYLPIETETQRLRSRDDAVATQRAAEQAATDRVLVSKGGAKVLTLRALDPSLSANALHALTHILGKWNEAGRRPVRIAASGVSDGTGMTSTNAQAALDELDAKKAIIVSVNSAGIRLTQPGLAVAQV